MIKKFIFVLLMLVSMSVSALGFDAVVGVTTNNVFRGQTISERGLSANAQFGVKSDNGLFGSYRLETAPMNASVNKVNTMNTLSAGYGQDLLGAKVSGGYTYRAFTGGSSNALAKVSDLNFGEVFVRGSICGFNAEIDQTVNESVGGMKDAYYTVGYSYKLGPYSLGANYEGKHYRNSIANSNYNGYNVVGTYDVTKNVLVSATYTHAGRDRTNVQLPSQTAVDLKYSF